MIERCTDGVLGQPDQFGVRTACSEDLGIVHSDYASPLPLKRASHHGCATWLSATTHDLVDELDQIVIQSHSDLLAHTKMVPLWDQQALLSRPGRHMGCASCPLRACIQDHRSWTGAAEPFEINPVSQSGDLRDPRWIGRADLLSSAVLTTLANRAPPSEVGSAPHAD